MTARSHRTSVSIRQLRLFATLASGGHPASDDEVLAALNGPQIRTQSRVDLYRKLYARLQALSPDPASKVRFECADPLWRDFERLQPQQQVAILLVLGLEFTAEEACQVLGESEDHLVMQVLAGMFCLEHFLPYSANGPADRAQVGMRRPPRSREAAPFEPPQSRTDHRDAAFI